MLFGFGFFVFLMCMLLGVGLLGWPVGVSGFVGFLCFCTVLGGCVLDRGCPCVAIIGIYVRFCLVVSFDRFFTFFCVLYRGFDVLVFGVLDILFVFLFDPELLVVLVVFVSGLLDPVVFAWAIFVFCLSAFLHVFSLGASIVILCVFFFVSFFTAGAFVLNGWFLVHLCGVFCRCVVLGRVIVVDVVLGVVLVLLHALGIAIFAFFDDGAVSVVSLLRGLPGFLLLRIGIFYKDVGIHACFCGFFCFDFMMSVLFVVYGQLYLVLFCYSRVVYVLFGISTLLVAVLGAGFSLVPSVPLIGGH
ncbi:hypothetical protein [Bacteroides graminisolvens]|uniref:hypothetical protein n=1 Tax=Bacteroides graminisolvens TaxID=477666 RepID=UPI00040D24F4|nr:hypothetical protein [Bacteroides graminisolvens]